MPEHKIKLLVVTPSLGCGGSEKYVSLFCNYIDTQKFTVTLCIINNDTSFYSITNTAIEIIDLQKKHVRSSLFALLKVIKLKQPDIIYTTANHLNVFIAMFSSLLRKNIITIARESSVVSSNTKRAKFPFLYNRLIKKYYKNFDCIICQSKYMQQDLIDNYFIAENKTVVINNPVEALQTSVKMPAINKLLTVARLSPEKGIDRLIQAIANLKTPFTYYIIGDGPERAKLQNLVNDLQLHQRIIFTGQKNNPYQGMEDAALFLMASYYEGFPNTLLEAGMLGIPVVAFNAPGGISEIITKGQNGLLVNDNKVIAFSHAIENALNLNFNRQQIQQTTQSKYLISNIINNTQNLLIQIYQHHPYKS